MEKRYCTTCGAEIPPARLKILPNTNKCVKHSTTQAVSGFMSWEHKTTPTLNICSAEEREKVDKLTKRNGQSPIRGIRMKGH